MKEEMPTFRSESQSVYKLMDDAVLAEAVADLQRALEQLGYSRQPAPPVVRAAYQDSLDKARAEQERRQC